MDHGLSPALIAVATLVCVCSTAHAAPTGNALIGIAETLEPKVFSADVSVVVPLRGGASDWWLNTQYGIGDNTEVGVDVPLQGPTRPVFNATRIVTSWDHTRARVGVLGLNSDGGEALELVVDRDLADTTIHAGLLHFMPDTTVFGGLTHPLGPSSHLHLEYLGGPEPLAAVGCDWNVGGNWNIIASGLHDFHGNPSLYLDLAWEITD